MRRLRDGWILLATVFLLATSFTSFFGWNRLRVDATAYWQAGTALRTGLPLYSATPVAALDKAYLYPPAFAGAFAALTLLPALWGYAVWMALELVLTVALARTAAALAAIDEADGDVRRTAAALALAVGLVPIAQNLVEGQVNLLVAWLAALALLEAERGRDGRAAFALAGAVHVKLVPIVLAGAFLLWRRFRLLAWLVAALVVVALVPVVWRIATLGLGPGLQTGAGDYADFWRLILWPGASAHRVAGVEQLFAPNYSLRGTLSRLFVDGVALSPFPELAARRGPLVGALPEPAVHAASSVLGLGGLAAALWLCRARAGDAAGRVSAAGLVLLAGALASPSCWEHHLVTMAVAAAGLWRVLAAEPAAQRVRTWAAATVPVIAVVTLPYLAALVSTEVERGPYRAVREYGLATAALIVFFAVVFTATLRRIGQRA